MTTSSHASATNAIIVKQQKTNHGKLVTYFNYAKHDQGIKEHEKQVPHLISSLPIVTVDSGMEDYVLHIG